MRIKMLSPLKLAFLGDAVFELYIRKSLVSCRYNKSVGELNKEKIKFVCCEGQSNIVKKILDILTPEELNIYKRGRNAHVKQCPQKSSPLDYHRATGLESLFGYLYLAGDFERIDRIMERIQEFICQGCVDEKACVSPNTGFSVRHT